MQERSLKVARIVSSVAATCISLACGTNYVYSAWAPQFAEKLKLSSTESNLIGLAGNFGMYSMGIPIGIFVDTEGPRPAVIVGSILLAVGYFPLRQAYVRGEASVALLCLFSACTGLGGCAAFAAAIKTSALNWPHHRGTATAFPLAAFGLSAFFFSIFSQVFLSGDTGDFLMLLAAGTFGLTFVCFFFLRVLPHSSYSTLPVNDGLLQSDSNPLRRTKSEERKYAAGQIVVEPGRSISSPLSFPRSSGGVLNCSTIGEASPGSSTPETDETSSLMSKDSSSDSGTAIEEENIVDKDHPHRLDLRGLKMLPKAEFWFLFSLMGILTGIGLMTINNIGNDVTALWRHYDSSVTPEFLTGRQAMHVSILSFCSFIGRLCSGVGSDFLVKRLHASRSWCLVIASLIFSAAQFCAISIENPAYLKFVSGLTGLAYGFLFGVYPSLVAEAFGVNGLSQNWGCMTLAPVVSGNIFNLFYGIVYDAHSVILPGGERQCDEGLSCYRSAYIVTIGACAIGLFVSLWSIQHAHSTRLRERKALEMDGHAA